MAGALREELDLRGVRHIEEQRDFKGVWIPASVYLDNRLSALEKIILAEIDSLDTEETGCYASNEHLALFCQCSVRKVTDAISKLSDIGYIFIERRDCRKRVLRSCLAKTARLPSKNCEVTTQNLPGNLAKSARYDDDTLYKKNILDIYNLDRKERKEIKERKDAGEKTPAKSKQFIPPTFEEVAEYAKSRNSSVDPRRFFDYFDAGHWIDSKGNPVRNWKQKLISWEGRGENERKQHPSNAKGGAEAKPKSTFVYDNG